MGFRSIALVQAHQQVQPLLELLVYPAIYKLWTMRTELRRPEGGEG